MGLKDRRSPNPEAACTEPLLLRLFSFLLSSPSLQGISRTPSCCSTHTTTLLRLFVPETSGRCPILVCADAMIILIGAQKWWSQRMESCRSPTGINTMQGTPLLMLGMNLGTDIPAVDQWVGDLGSTRRSCERTSNVETWKFQIVGQGPNRRAPPERLERDPNFWAPALLLGGGV